MVIKHLNLLETSYFGLKYLDTSRFQGSNHERSENRVVEQVWLDMNKSAIKQLRDIQPMTVYFGVKYYASDPCKLAEEITRYQFFLQCKQDILHSRLAVPFDLAVELFALAVQSELGDYDPQRHQDGYVGEFQFLAVNQSAELERRVALFHRSLTGQVPATAELNFLERVKWLDLYGCELHPIQYEDNGEEYALGLNPTGVLVLRNRLKVAHYMWPHIVKTKSQGRCFLMDVLEPASSKSHANGPAKQQTAPKQPTRNRFGFRLVDKEASRRLRWAIDEHKSFYHLVHNSASLSQLASSRQQQQLKLSQKFRNSIRSAISVGGFAQSSNHLAGQHQKLRSSMKSLNEAANAAHLHQQQQQQQQHQYFATSSALDRAPPSVVRMPSRRYSNRSLTRPQFPLSSANGNGLPAMPHTMVDSQRQQALMMMSQLNQINAMVGKSHTLKPTSSASAKDMRRNPYYHMMAGVQGRPDIAFLPPGQHIVQPSIYKAASVVNGLNQVSLGQPGKQSALMQFFNTRPQYGASGHESPRSTKSAIAPASALKLASKKLAKQQQILYANQQDVQPLLVAPGAPYEMMASQHSGAASLLYSAGHGGAQYHGAPAPYSTNHSPRSVRSARIASRHKSKSTNENLHLLHDQTYADSADPNGKMLLATAVNMMPPPNYSNSAPRKRATFVMNNDQGNLLMSTANLMPRARAGQSVPERVLSRPSQQATSDGEDDYYCSRSDCSSIQDRAERRRRSAMIEDQSLKEARHPPRRSSQSKPSADNRPGHEEWDSIKRRHNEFSTGKGYLAGNPPQQLYGNQKSFVDGREPIEDLNNNSNNNNLSLVKSMANKQATPILLSMNYDHSNANSKAVQLLNLQRQQLNSQATVQTDPDNGGSHFGKTSEPSSAASSPPSASVHHDATSGPNNKASSKTSDSAASSSTTTSGYYAGSNSTGSASLDSDSQTAETSPGNKSNSRRARDHQTAAGWSSLVDETSSRAKIALGSYGSRLVSNGRTTQLCAGLKDQTQPRSAVAGHQRQQQRFYLGEGTKLGPGSNSNVQREESASSNDTNGQWSPLNQLQQHPPSSLKYVSFDV